MAETIKTRIRITRYSTNGVSRYWEDPEGLGREGGGRGESGWGIKKKRKREKKKRWEEKKKGGEIYMPVG